MLGIIAGTTRPDKLTSDKDKQYHVDFSRYALYTSFDQRHAQWLEECDLNRRFYRNEQWFLEEDLEAFFKDESGQARNRIKVVKNKILGIVEQYRGNAIIMDITGRVESVSYKAINRREEKLAEMLYWTDVANNTDEATANVIREKFPIGKNEKETTEMFDNIYQDTFIHDINALIEYTAKENKFEEKRPELATDLALTGKGTLMYEVHNGDFIWRRIQTERTFWDRSGQEYDLSDAEFKGHWDMLTDTEIFESAQDLTDDERKAISDGITAQSNTYFCINGKAPVFTVYWKDFEQYDYGYVKDQFGYDYLARIDYTFDGEDKPRYTKNDVIPYKDLNPTQQRLVGKSGMRKLFVDVMRWCRFIPSEIIGTSMSNGTMGDIVLDWGIANYQDTENYKISNVSFPYKDYCWMYFDGYVSSPVSYLINPQRMINRYSSVMENLVNSAKGNNIFYDKDAIGAEEDESEMLSNLNQSKPVGVHGRLRGIHNIIQEYRPSLDSVLVYETLNNMMKNDIDQIIGVNAPLRGEGSSDALVGVTQLQIQRASLIQEPYYNALANIYLQAYQATANVGKRVWCDNNRKLSIMLGDSGARTIQISKEHVLEDFRAFIERSQSYQQEKRAANSLAVSFLQMGLINKEVFSRLFNNSTTTDVAFALREFTKINSEVEKQQAAMQQQEAANAQQMIGQEMQKKQTAEVAKVLNDNRQKEEDRRNKLQQKALSILPQMEGGGIDVPPPTQ